MTAIIVVVVVALVFFVAVCVVAFMIWKREAEMRTDSIRAIEENLERLTQEMSPEQDAQDRQVFAEKEAGISYMESLIAQSAAGRPAGRRTRRREQDPFEWVRANGEAVWSSSGSEQEKPDHGEGFDPYDSGLADSEAVLNCTLQNEPDNGKTEAAASGDHGADRAELPAADTADPESADIQESSQMHDIRDDAGIDDDTDSSGEDALAEKTVSEDGRKKSALTEMQKMLKELDVPELRKMPEMQMSGNEDHGDREEQQDEKESYEISLDFIDEMDIASEQEQMPASRMGYDVGRSGRKYTASELEKLIKE